MVISNEVALTHAMNTWYLLHFFYKYEKLRNRDPRSQTVSFIIKIYLLLESDTLTPVFCATQQFSELYYSSNRKSNRQSFNWLSSTVTKLKRIMQEKKLRELLPELKPSWKDRMRCPIWEQTPTFKLRKVLLWKRQYNLNI